jgi:electron transfer flavoprotein alpha subunit
MSQSLTQKQNSSGTNIFVLLEPAGEKSMEINQGLLTEGHRIASSLGCCLSALTIGDLPADADPFKSYGLTTLYYVQGEGLSQYSSETYSWAAAEAMKGLSFRLLLLAHSDSGRDLAPRIAALLDTQAITDCVDIRFRDRTLFYVRSLYGGRLEQEISYKDQARPIASLSLAALNKREIGTSESFQISRIPIQIPSDLVGTKTLEIITPDYQTIDILHTKRIVGAGLGCADSKLLGLAEELSYLLEGSIGTTRPVVDDGLLPRDRMIGQTGKTVSPELYLALGISGSTHHMAGLQQSKTILSVNRDTHAPILGMADAGFVGDLETLLPKLIDRIKRYRDESV